MDICFTEETLKIPVIEMESIEKRKELIKNADIYWDDCKQNDPVFEKAIDNFMFNETCLTNFFYLMKVHGYFFKRDNESLKYFMQHAIALSYLLLGSSVLKWLLKRRTRYSLNRVFRFSY